MFGEYFKGPLYEFSVYIMILMTNIKKLNVL